MNATERDRAWMAWDHDQDNRARCLWCGELYTASADSYSELPRFCLRCVSEGCPALWANDNPPTLFDYVQPAHEGTGLYYFEGGEVENFFGAAKRLVAAGATSEQAFRQMARIRAEAGARLGVERAAVRAAIREGGQ